LAYKSKFLTPAEGGLGASTTATSAKILIGDGTNWVASTPTYPTTAGTSGNVLTSNGTNWTSATAPGGGLLTATVTLTSAQIKALNATPIQLVAAPGANKIIMLEQAAAKFTYGGTNVFVAGASQVINIFWNNGVTAAYSTGAPLISNATIVGSANKFCAGLSGPTSVVNQVAGILDNVNLVVQNPIATEITGNAANNNTITIVVQYWIADVT